MKPDIVVSDDITLVTLQSYGYRCGYDFVVTGAEFNDKSFIYDK